MACNKKCFSKILSALFAPFSTLPPPARALSLPLPLSVTRISLVYWLSPASIQPNFHNKPSDFESVFINNNNKIEPDSTE